MTRFLLLLLVLAFVAPALVLADTVELRTGERVEGQLKEANPRSVVLQVGGQTLSFPTADVRAIYFGSSPSAAKPSPPAAKPEAESAIQALKALRSVTGLGVSYVDYRQRLADTKIKVDAYLEVKTSGNDRDVQTAVKSALFHYETALPIWQQQLQQGREGTVSLALVDSLHQTACPMLRSQTQKIRNAYSEITDRVGTRADSSYTQDLISGIWACASARIKEADDKNGRRSR